MVKENSVNIHTRLDSTIQKELWHLGKHWKEWPKLDSWLTQRTQKSTQSKLKTWMLRPKNHKTARRKHRI